MRYAAIGLFLIIGTLGAAAVADEPKKEEKPKGFIGVAMDAVATPDSRTALRVADVVPDSPGEAAGVKPGDLILALDGEPIAWTVQEAPAKFRERIGARSPGDRVRLLLRRTENEVERRTAGGAWGRVSGLPDLGKLLEENAGKRVEVRGERTTLERETTVVLGKRPGETDKLLPSQAELRADREAQPLEPEAALAQRLVARTGAQDVYEDVLKSLAKDEKVDDPYRLATVRYAKRDPLKLPGVAKDLARSLAPAARPGGLPFFCFAAARVEGAALSTAPILTSQAPQAPPLGVGIREHVDYVLALMHRARDTIAYACSSVTPAERETLVKELPSLARKFQENIVVHEDPDRERWRRHAKTIELAAKVDRRMLTQALLELAPLAEPAYLDRLAADLGRAEAQGGTYMAGNNEGTHGPVLLEETTDLGSIVVGGSGPNVYRGDYALIIDLGGNDRYLRHAGGATPERPVAVCLDLDGDDVYSATEPFAQGAAFLGAGLLVDRRGNDRYTSDEPFVQGAALCGAAALVDFAGNDEYRGAGFCQGAAFMQGAAALLDGEGNDRYEAGVDAQGFAGPGTVAALVDGAGDDVYAALGAKRSGYGEPGLFDGFAQGVGCGIRGRASGGIGALVDVAGNDRYLAGNFAQGGGYYFGFGLLADLGQGDDEYEGTRYAQGFAAHSALGALWDDGGNDRYGGSIGAIAGAAWDLSVAAFLDEGGDDRYDGASNFSLGASAHNGLALFFDRGGRDRYRHLPGPARSGPNDYHGGQSLSIFVDAGGAPNVYEHRGSVVAPVASGSVAALATYVEGVAFIPSAGVGLARQPGGGTSVFADLPCEPEAASDARLDALIRGTGR